MISARKWIRDLFGFSASEINGFIILVPLMVLLLCSEPLYHTWISTRPEQADEPVVLLDSMLVMWARSTPSSALTKEGSLFDFDPNTATVEDLINLGFGDILAKRIVAYRSKGGTFREKSDLLKIYGLDSTLYKQLYDHITLPASQPRGGKRRIAFAKPRSTDVKIETVSTPFDLNTADTLLLKSVYGIGPRLAARIIKFRESLGGFINPGQLYEVYGLDSLVVEELHSKSFIHSDFKPQRININQANEKELSAHPYIRFKLARLLVSYRFQHGDFIAVTDIKKLSEVKAEEVERLLPYLMVRE